MLSKHGGRQAQRLWCAVPHALGSRWDSIGTGPRALQGQSEASPIVCMGRFHPLSRGESSMFQLLKARKE